MPSKSDLGGYYDREVALLLIRMLQTYLYPLKRPRPPEDPVASIHEVDYSGTPIDEDHPLWMAVNEYIRSLPDGLMPIEGRELWYSLIESSRVDPGKAREFARKFHDWIARDVTLQERMVFIEGSSPELNTVILDGQPYGNVPITGLRILKALYELKGQYVTHQQIQNMKIPGCRGDEKTIRRHIERIPTSLRRLIKSKRGRGRYLELP